MKRGVEGLSEAFERTNAFFFEKSVQLLMDDANAVNQRTLLVFYGTEEAFEVIHNIQQACDKPPQLLSSELGALSINTAAVVVEISESAKIKMVL